MGAGQPADSLLLLGPGQEQQAPLPSSSTGDAACRPPPHQGAAWTHPAHGWAPPLPTPPNAAGRAKCLCDCVFLVICGPVMLAMAAAFFAAFVVMPVYTVAGLTGEALAQSAKLHRWLPVAATSLGDGATFTYAFGANRTVYNCSTPLPWTDAPGDNAGVLAHVPAGGRVVAYVDPASPSHAYVFRQPFIAIYIGILFLSTFTTIFFWFILPALEAVGRAVSPTHGLRCVTGALVAVHSAVGVASLAQWIYDFGPIWDLGAVAMFGVYGAMAVVFARVRASLLAAQQQQEGGGTGGAGEAGKDRGGAAGQQSGGGGGWKPLFAGGGGGGGYVPLVHFASRQDQGQQHGKGEAVLPA